MTNPARAPERARECRHGINTFTPPCPACQRLEELVAERAREWQPMNTAPKTIGAYALVFSHGSTFRARLCIDGWSASPGLLEQLRPTHWMPLPDPPTGAAVAPVEGPS